MDVSAHGEVDEDEDVELDEDGEAEEDGVQHEAGQAQPPVQRPLVEMDAQNLQVGRIYVVFGYDLVDPNHWEAEQEQ